MSSIVCTLFEGQYHYGVAALLNSLYVNGYKGNVYIGYRGDLPPWATDAKPENNPDWSGVKTLEPIKGFGIHFIPVITTRHLTNYKAQFLLALMKYTDTGIFYFDPDIVIKCNWSFYEEWIQYGVALVQEIASNSVSPNHPKRARWRQVIEACGKKVERELHHYYNGGFCGVSKGNEEFIDTWERVMEIGIKDYEMDDHYFSKPINQLSMFPVGDQDAINVAAMCCTSPISDFGPEGMDFTYGGWLMSHATGKPKPWTLSFLSKAFKGQKISAAEKEYWKYANGIIQSVPNNRLKRKKLSIKIGSLLNRFYSRT